MPRRKKRQMAKQPKRSKPKLSSVSNPLITIPSHSSRKLDTDGEVGEAGSLFGLLSDDGLIQVLRKLATRYLLSYASFVCKRWRRLCQEHLVLELVPPVSSHKVRPWGSLEEKQVMELAAHYAPTIEKVELYGLQKITADDILQLIHTLPHLQCLAIISCMLIFSTDIENIIKNLPLDLRIFDLHLDHNLSCFTPATINECYAIQDSHLSMLVERCPGLQRLNLDTCGIITSRGLEALSAYHASLTSLDLSSHQISWIDIEKLCKSCKSLQHLSVVSAILQDANPNEERFDIGTSRMFNIWGQTKKPKQPALDFVELPLALSSLRLYSSPHRSALLDSFPLLGIIKNSGRQLRELHAQALFNTSWHTISVWCANLKVLDLSHESNSFSHLTGIEEIVLRGIPRLVKKLERIALPFTTDLILIEFGQFCPNLKELRFQGYTCGREGVNSLSTVTDRGIMALAEGCSSLQVLSLAGCKMISNSSVRALAFHCTKLKALYLTGCFHIGDDSIEILLSALGHTLQILDIRECPKVTVATYSSLKNSKVKEISLRVLVVSLAIWKMSKGEISNLKLCLPRLSVTYFPQAWDGFYHSKEL